MADIGIDLGTTNSVLAFLRGGPEVINLKGKPILPSAVMYDEGDWVVGAAAKSQLAARPDSVIVSPKRHMGTDKTYTIDGRTYTPVNMSAKILREIKKGAEEFLGEPVGKAVITIPAHFAYNAVEDTRKAAEEAGLSVGQLLQEPVAASATYGTGGEETILVFDLGGGTLDCTVVDIFDSKILGMSGDNWLGGDDFDYRIVDRMLKHFKEESGIDLTNDPRARLSLKGVAEQHKINLSEANATQIEVVRKVSGKLCQIDFRLTRKEYNQMIDDLVTRAIQKADEAIERAAIKMPGLTKEDVDVILLVGGSTLTPYVQECLEQHFGKPPCKRVDPMLAVGLGAAICTRDIAVDPTQHRVALKSRAQVWSRPKYLIKGRTTARSKIEISGGAQPARGAADGEGLFAVEVGLTANSVNDLTVRAIAPNGTDGKALHRIRHDETATTAAEPPPPPPIRPPLPRNILLGVDEDQIAIIVKAGTDLPTAGEIADRFFTKAANVQRTVQGPVYEGHHPDHEIPYGPLNTYMGQLLITCPPTSVDTPVVIGYEVDESRNITMRCWFKHDPSVRGEVKIKCEAVSREKKHIIERCEVMFNEIWQRLPAEERRTLLQKQQALKDLSEQYTTDQSEETRQRIIKIGKELQETLTALEKRYQL